jgi:hypothetical protein
MCVMVDTSRRIREELGRGASASAMPEGARQPPISFRYQEAPPWRAGERAEIQRRLSQVLTSSISTPR